MIQLFNALSDDANDVINVVQELIKFVGFCICIMKVALLHVLKEPISTLISFITNKRIHSGDASFDEREQQKFNKSSRLLVLSIGGLILTDTACLSIPAAATESVLGLPPQLIWTGKAGYVSAFLRFLFVNLMSIGIYPRFFSNLACTGILLMGMRTKLRILAHRYRQMLKRVDQGLEYNFEQVNQDIKEASDQQLEYWR